MTLGSLLSPDAVSRLRVSRRVSSNGMYQEGKLHEPFEPLSGSFLRRQVSNEAFSESDDDACCKAGVKKRLCEKEPACACTNGALPLYPNPIRSSQMFARHKASLRLEGELQPMRLILSRLMAHPTLNRKGIFNVPVDPVKLNLPDYFTIIKHPMDFGTIKAKLHALAYQSREEVYDHIRLVFDNAMKYNPPHNMVHISAKGLLEFFEDQIRSFVPDLANVAWSDTSKYSNQCSSERVSSPTSAAHSSSFSLPTSPTELTTSNSTEMKGLPCMSSNPAHTQGTRLSTISECFAESDALAGQKRKKRGSRTNVDHDCYICEGRICTICWQGCLHLEPTLLICNGFNCAGAKIRKGTFYYVAPDGSCHYCQKCYAGLPAILPRSNDTVCRYKASLLKRKNEEEVVERWVTCVKCHNSVHVMCALFNEYVDSKDNFVCHECGVSALSETRSSHCVNDAYTFVTGKLLPVPVAEIFGPCHRNDHPSTADTLPETEESAFLQCKIREIMRTSDIPHVEETVLVRIISDCSRSFDVPDVIRKHFQMASHDANARISPPTKVNYRSKAIALFQKFDGLDVCIFCMYVQEYDGDDSYEQPTDKDSVRACKRVYIAYLDSVEHFRPRSCRTLVFHELLVGYLASARKRGYESAHIWACPPSRGNSFVFWNHPSSQKTPTSERLEAWYHGALSRAIDCGVVYDVKSFFETSFEKEVPNSVGLLDPTLQVKMLCPPLLDGDFWIEEAVRLHDINFSRHLKAKPDAHAGGEGPRRCPAIEVADLIRDRVIGYPSSVYFRRPVNAAVLNLEDYHKVISKPMDLGTVYSRLVLGEYDFLKDVVADVELVFSNAKRYNPPGHIVHESAGEVAGLFFVELNKLISSWMDDFDTTMSWTLFGDLSMTLDVFLEPGPAHVLVARVDSSRSKATLESNSVLAGAASQKTPTLPFDDLVNGGPSAIRSRMVGTDTWLLDKYNSAPSKTSSKSTASRQRKKKEKEVTDDALTKGRRQSWLAEELSVSVRKNRTSFFYCLLQPPSAASKLEFEKIEAFESYVSAFGLSNDDTVVSSGIADARHALLEFSQFRNLEFDTLRRAKYSSTIILYHLHHSDAPGLVPVCTICGTDIRVVRWHRPTKVIERRRTVKRLSVSGPQQANCVVAEELCASCHAVHPFKDEFLPMQVSLK